MTVQNLIVSLKEREINTNNRYIKYTSVSTENVSLHFLKLYDFFFFNATLETGIRICIFICINTY